MSKESIVTVRSLTVESTNILELKEVKGANNKQSSDSGSKQVFEDEIDLGDQLSKNTNTDVSEFYESFDLPYTAIYKEPVN